MLARDSDNKRQRTYQLEHFIDAEFKQSMDKAIELLANGELDFRTYKNLFDRDYVLVLSGAGIRYPIFGGMYAYARFASITNRPPEAIFATSGGAIIAVLIKFVELITLPLLALITVILQQVYRVDLSYIFRAVLFVSFKMLLSSSLFDYKRLLKPFLIRTAWIVGLNDGARKTDSAITRFREQILNVLSYPTRKLALLSNQLKLIVSLYRNYGLYSWQPELTLLNLIRFLLQLVKQYVFYVTVFIAKQKQLAPDIANLITLIDRQIHSIDRISRALNKLTKSCSIRSSFRKYRLCFIENRDRINQFVQKSSELFNHFDFYQLSYSSLLRRILQVLDLSDIRAILNGKGLQLFEQYNVIRYTLNGEFGNKDEDSNKLAIFASTTNLTYRNYELLSNQTDSILVDLYNAAASASAPFFFSPTFVFSNNHNRYCWYTDGGLTKQLPIDDAYYFAVRHNIKNIATLNMNPNLAISNSDEIVRTLREDDSLFYLYTQYIATNLDESNPVDFEMDIGARKASFIPNTASKLFEAMINSVLQANVSEAFDDILQTQPTADFASITNHSNPSSWTNSLSANSQLIDTIRFGNNRLSDYTITTDSSSIRLSVFDIAAADIDSFLIEQFLIDEKFRFGMFRYGQLIIDKLLN